MPYKDPVKQRAAQKKAWVKKKATDKEPEVEKVELTRLQKEILKPDKRPVCPVHGHRNTVTLRHIGRPRFICCGRGAEQRYVA